ncbi:MAG: fumarylacetoacetase [Terracidiphilus sp.]
MAVSQQSWIPSANEPNSDFPLQNLPYGVFRHDGQTSIGIAIGDQILNLKACADQGLLRPLPGLIVDALRADTMNPFMALGAEAWKVSRRHVTEILGVQKSGTQSSSILAPLLVPMAEAEMHLPAQIGDYTDFYASIDHATRVGKLFRPDNPLLPNYKYVPIGYHGRASSLTVSGHKVRRPRGQIKSGDSEPLFAPTRSLDYELEVGALVGSGNAQGQSIPIAEAEERIFGLCLVNDWSARDMQAWEYQPLGPFLAKSFATTISPWIVPMEALAPYRVEARERLASEPASLSYLSSPFTDRDGIDLHLEVSLQSKRMRAAGMDPFVVSRSNLKDLYWTLRQLVTHHASNGCNLRTGDLLATGTVSGPGDGSEGCLLEMKHRSTSVSLPTGEMRTFLEDDDHVAFRAFACKEGLPRIGFGECKGTIVGADAVELESPPMP